MGEIIALPEQASLALPYLLLKGGRKHSTDAHPANIHYLVMTPKFPTSRNWR